MAQGRPEDARYFVGCVEDVDEFKRAMGGAGEITQSQRMDEGGCAVLVSSSLQHSETLMPLLGPNAQMVEDEEEAKTVYRVLVEGRPYEPRSA